MTDAERRAKERRLNELKKALQEAFGRTAVSPTTLDSLGRRGHMDEWLEDRAPLEHVMEEVEELLEYREDILRHEAPRSIPPTRGMPIEVALNKREEELAMVLSVYLARQATVLPDVRQYRKEKLGSADELLEPEAVQNFLRRELIAAGEQKAMVLTLSLEELLALASYSPGEVLSFDEAILPTPKEGLVLFFQDEVSDLGDLSSRLAALYPWKAEDAAWFVLTGEPPDVVSVSLSYHAARRTFTSSFAPWISENTFRRIYRKARDRAHGEENRQPGSKALAVLRFVSERTPPTEKPRWTDLVESWNQDDNIPALWKFKSVSAFRKLYLRTQLRVAGSWIDRSW
jgi:hypothetical protein